MSYYLIRQIDEIPNVGIRTTEVIAVPVTITSSSSPCATRMPARRRRCVPATSSCSSAQNLEPSGSSVSSRVTRGFVLTGPDLLRDGERPRGWGLDRDPYYLEASVPGVFAAGDVRANSIKRVASAVGEGAMAIQLLHTYLEHQ